MTNVVLIEDSEVIPALTRLRLPKPVMLDILDRAAGERARVNSNDPSATGGNEMRRWLTRFLREDETLRALKWVACSHDQLEGIRNDETGKKLIALNTDARAGMPAKEPISVSDKGPAAVKAVKGNEDRRQGTLFPQPAAPADPIASYDFLYFCVHASDASLSAEISRPSGFEAGFVAHYSQRIMLSQPGEKPGLRRPDPVSEDFAEVEKPTIIRRK